MNFSQASVKRPVTTLMCVLVAVCFGLMSLLNLQMDMLPNMNIPIVVVISTYDGASSEEVKTLLTEPIESGVASVSGLDSLTSTSSAGSSFVIIKFDYDVNIDVAAQDVREKIDMVKYSLPDAASDPMVMKLDINSMTGNIYLSATAQGKDINELKELIEDKVAPRLERQNGVASVNIMGGNEKEIKVTLNQEKMRALGISESTVTSMLAAENINTPLGSINQGDKKLTLRIKGEFRDLNEIRDVIIPTGTGGTVFLSDIASVKETYEDTGSFSYTNGEESIFLAISKNSTANTVNVSKAVFTEMAKIQTEMPEIDFITINDPAEYIQQALTSVVESAVLGGLLAIIILFIFLREIRSTLIVAMSIPVSIITTFAVMNFANVNFNLMSLGGLVMGIGMLVDNSIVVMESIFKKLESGEDRIHAAIHGGQEVGNSVLASTLTTVAVFLPIVFVGGQVAELFNDMALTIVFSLLSSLVVAVTFVPMACSVLLSPESIKPKKAKTIFGKILNLVLDPISLLIVKIEKGYAKLLNKALGLKKLTVAIAIAFVVLTGMVIPTMNTEFMPSTDEGQITIDITLPKGTAIEKTEEISWKVADAVKNVPEIKTISLRAGSMGMLGGGEDTSSLTIALIDKEDGRKRTSDEVAMEMRKLVSGIAGAEIEVSSSGTSMGSYSSGGVEIQVFSDDSEALKTVSNDMVNILKEFGGLSDVKSSIEDSSPNTTIRIDKRKANSLGISVASISGLLRTDISGSAATTYKINGDEYDINVTLDDERVNYISDVEQLLIPTSFGGSVPLSEISEIIPEDVPVSISRENQTDYVSITANFDGSNLKEVQTKFNEKMQGYLLPSSCTWKYGGTAEQMAEAFLGLFVALVVAVLLVYMIMAAEFEAFSFPFIVMFSIPIALTAGLFGCFLYGESISVTSLLGLIMLAGVVVNNAIVLIDYANLQMRENGFSFKESMNIAGPARLRPILMSTLTTVLGMLPMMVSTSTGSENMRGLAVTVVFGLTFSTLITLILIPAIYVAFNERLDKRRKKRALKRERKLAKEMANA